MRVTSRGGLGYRHQSTVLSLCLSVCPVASGAAAPEAVAFHLLGTALVYENKPEQARRCLTQTLTRNATHPEDHARLGDVYLAQDKPALAVEAYTRALELGLNDAGLHFQLASAYFRLRNYLGAVERRTVPGGKSEKMVGSAYLLEPVSPGEDIFLASPPQSAIFHAQKARDLGKDDLEMRLLLGDIWLEARHYKRALREYLAINSDMPPARRVKFCANLARAWSACGDEEAAVLMLREAAQIDRVTYLPDLEKAYLCAAERYNRLGDLGGYLKWLGQGAQDVPASSELHYRLGNALWEDGRQTEAVREWRIALELQPDHPDRVRMLKLIQKTGTPNGS